ncbi:MAG: acetylglutamate kinase [Oscillospiraceae bacterium]|nr:acetylglutamate kinase [Oscillospiraceae bacterium]
MSNLSRAAILSEALPYIQKFHKKTVVVKYGGAAMESEELKRAVITDIVLLSLASIRVVVVHGGGPEINAVLGQIGKEPKFVNGLRYTDDETMDVVQMVLAGKIGKDLAGIVHELGGRAISLCGADGGLFHGEKLSGDIDYGLVGELKSVDPECVNMALDNGYIPIISTIAQGSDSMLNINADTAAGALAAAMNAEKLILLTDVRGIMSDPHDDTTLLASLTLSDIPALIKNGVIKKGMIPKVECCVEAVRRGVNSAHILDGRMPHSILVEMLSDSGVGTMIGR